MIKPFRQSLLAVGVIALFCVLPVAGVSADLPAHCWMDAVTVMAPKTPPSALVILFSDPTLAGPFAKGSFQALVEAGQLVAMVDGARYLKALEKSCGTCIRAAADLATLKADLFSRYHLPPNTPAVLAGPGSGGGLAYAVLSQCPPGQFDGAMAFELNPELPGRIPFCNGAPYRKSARGIRYLPFKPPCGFWRIATASPHDIQWRPYLKAQPDVLLPLRSYDDLSSAIISLLAAERRPAPVIADGIADLPLVLLPVGHHSGTMAIIYSGDGGWRDLDKQIGGALQAAGIPVVGVDTLRGFWNRQTPETAAGGLERIIAHFVEAWQAPDVLLIGYSFGADIIPFMVNRIKPAALAHIRLVALMGLSHDATFEIHMSGWLGTASASDALPLKPELLKLDRQRVQCFFGQDEGGDSGCTDSALEGAEIVKTAGGHHFDGDYRKLARIIIQGAARRGVRLPGGQGGTS